MPFPTAIDVSHSRRDQYEASIPTDDTDSTDLICRPHPRHARIVPRLWAMIDTTKIWFLGEVSIGTALLAHRMDYQLVLISAQPMMDTETGQSHQRVIAPPHHNLPWVDNKPCEDTLMKYGEFL
jgi:hypothetical protein